MSDINDRNLVQLILKLMALRSYILDKSKIDEIKKTIAYQLYMGIEDDLVSEKKQLNEITPMEVELHAIRILHDLRKDFAKTSSILLKHIENIDISDLMKYYDKAMEKSDIFQKVEKFEKELFASKQDKYYSVSDAIDILGYSHKGSIYNHIAKGNLKAKKISERKTIIFEKDLDNFIRKTYKKSLTEYSHLSKEEKKKLHKN